ncbi:MAG: hypothetical protein LQ347_005562 [Umbilicaria vellea]|nr:MAG: hypothetical protein LQ347_005562 [Umbilicaria vellea]
MCNQEADIDEEVESPSTSPDLAVRVSTSFPSSEIFGIKLINGHPTQALLSITNDEPAPITVAFIGGSLWSENIGQGIILVRNLTTTRYNVEVPAGEKESLSYSFATELHPQDMKLSLATVITDSEGAFYTIQAFNETVSIVEQDTSIFDPQITWITTLFPQKRRGGKGVERVKRSFGQSKKVDPADQVAVTGADGPAVTSSSKAYDESWIPAHHINKPEARRLKSGGPRPKNRSKPD